MKTINFCQLLNTLQSLCLHKYYQQKQTFPNKKHISKIVTLSTGESVVRLFLFWSQWDCSHCFSEHWRPTSRTINPQSKNQPTLGISDTYHYPKGTVSILTLEKSLSYSVSLFCRGLSFHSVCCSKPGPSDSAKCLSASVWRAVFFFSIYFHFIR